MCQRRRRTQSGNSNEAVTQTVYDGTMKKIFALPALALTLSLASCGSGPAAPQATAKVQNIQGKVDSGSGVGTVTANDPVLGQLSRATVTPEGSFTLALPDANKLAPQLQTASDVLKGVGCSGTLNSSVPGAKGYGLVTLDLNRNAVGKVLAGQVTSKTLSKSFDGYAWIYTDQATTLTGSLDCQNLVGLGMALPTTVNVTTSGAGWHMVSVTGKGSLGLGGISASGEVKNVADTPTTWRLVSEL